MNYHYTNDNCTLETYKATDTMMMANYTLIPFSKLTYFNKGKSLLEKSISRESSNVEARFLRFTVQSASPAFLGYNKSIQIDKDFLLKNLSSLNDLQLKHIIISFLKTSKNLSDKEKQNLKI